MALVAHQRHLDFAQSTVLARQMLPLPHAVLRVGRDKSDGAVALGELVDCIVEGEHFGWAYEREGGGDEEEEEPLLALYVVVQREF